MIISHKHKFIFIKTAKTAGTSIEIFLSKHCGENDIVTPFGAPAEGHVPRNYKGLWNPIPEMLLSKGRDRLRVLSRLLKRRKFYNHIAAKFVRTMVPKDIWNGYFKFCVDRNPWDKTLSHYHMIKQWKGGQLSFERYIRRGKFALNFPMYTDSRGNLLVDRVVKYESLTAELAQIFQQLGIPFEGSLGVKAKSEYRKDRTPYQQVFKDDQRKIIERAFRREIEMHGYDFESGIAAPRNIIGGVK